MSSSSRLLAAIGSLAVVLVHCGANSPTPVDRGSLDGAIARAGAFTIEPLLVSTVAAAKGQTPREVIGDLLDDAVAAQGAEARGFGSDPRVAWGRASALARRVPTRFIDDAVAAGPPTDGELASVSVVHAVVTRSASLHEEDAIGIARAIRQAVVGVRTADDFLVRAQAVAHPHARVIAQPVGPFGIDGVDASGGELDAGFVAAAFALRVPFDTSPIVATPFGWHVLQLVERKAPDTAAELGFRRAALAGSVLAVRARTRLEDLLRLRRSSARIDIAVAADELMARATAAP